MKIKKESWNPERILIWSIAFLVSLFGLANLIATCWYSFDEKMSQIFYQGMDHRFIKGWAAYTIQDGYYAIGVWLLPMFFILLESLFLYMKKIRPHGWFAHHQSDTWWCMLITGLWTVGFLIDAVFCFFGNHGFGWGFSYEFQTGWDYMIPGFIVSIIVNFTYLWLAVYYVHWHLAKQETFLQAEYWKKTFVVLFFIVWIYLPLILLKPGFRRLYYYSIIWGDILKKVEVSNPDRFLYYVSQDQWHYGFDPQKAIGIIPNGGLDFWAGSNLDGQWINNSIYNMPIDQYEWWKPYGFFTKNPPYPLDAIAGNSITAFPSGHISASCGMGMTTYIFTGKGRVTKKQRIGSQIGFLLFFLYVFDMAFALQVSLSHWWSDICFTLFWSIPAYFLGVETTQLTLLILKKIQQKLINPKKKAKKRVNGVESI